MEYNGTTNFGAVQPKMPPDLQMCGHIPGGDHMCHCGVDGPSPDSARHLLRKDFATF